MSTSAVRFADAIDLPGRPPVLARPTARAVLLAALSLGITADSLIQLGPAGVAFPLFVALVALNLVAIVRNDGHAIPAESGAWLAAACVFSLGVVWRNADLLGAADWMAAQGCLMMAAIRMRDSRSGLLAPRFRRTIAAVAILAGDVIAGLFPTLRRDLRSPAADDAIRSRVRRTLRPALFGLVVLGVFGPLLRAADPIFASYLRLPAIDAGEAMSHVITVAVFAWIFAGWTRSALLPAGERRVFTYGFSLSRADVTTILGTLDVLFALFVVAQLGWIFGGEAFLRARTGLTAAAYARQGFFQMCFIAALVAPMLLVTRGALVPDRRVRRRHTMLALPAIVLLGAMIGSAALRMNLYVRYYGLSVDRFYPMVFMGWLATVLLWMTATVLRDRGRTFVAGALGSGLLTLAGLNFVDPDGLVARVSVAHQAQAGLDVEYLAQLRGGAVPIATRAALAPRRILATPALQEAEDARVCRAANTLLYRWGPGSERERTSRSDGAWRAWNADDARALAVVRENTPALIQTVHARCAGHRPAWWSYR